MNRVQDAGHEVHLSPIMDLHNGEIVAYQMKRRPVFDLVRGMLDQSIKTLSPAASRAAACRQANLRHHGHPAPARTVPCSSTCF